jgi:hypothetical protein
MYNSKRTKYTEETVWTIEWANNNLSRGNSKRRTLNIP